MFDTRCQVEVGAGGRLEAMCLGKHSLCNDSKWRGLKMFRATPDLLPMIAFRLQQDTP